MEPGAEHRRSAAVAGRFYPADAGELEALVTKFLTAASGIAPQSRIALMAPHAGYVYSGAIAAHAFAATRIPRRVIVLGPNHTGRGQPTALWPRGAFDLPGGSLYIDEALAARLVLLFEADEEAHLGEHSVEVELPFLRRLRPDVVIAPVVLGRIDAKGCVALGEKLARVVAELNDEVLVVASSDMSHYLPDKVARKIDHRALEPLLALDPEGLHARVIGERISMCGIIPATVMLAYARARGASRASVLAYGTSGDAFGDREEVVGYASVVVD